MNQIRQADQGHGDWTTTQRHQHFPHDEGSGGLRYLDDPDPTGEVWDETVALLAGELVALRTRLATVEAAIGRPGPIGAPAPPTLPALARRIATLERQAGIVPGLDLLAGTKAMPTTRPASAAPAPRTRGQVWRDRGQAALAALVLLAVFAWLLRPTVRPATTARPTATATSAPTAAPVPTAGAPAAAQPASDTRCDGLASEVCAGNDGHLATPAALTGETPCPLGGAVPCGTAGDLSTTTTVTPALCLAPVGAAGEACSAGAPAAPATRATWAVALGVVPPCAGDELAAACPRDAPFAPAQLIIQAGDTVVWLVAGGPHTITFPATGTLAPPLYLTWPGETTGELNPLAADPQGGAVYDGTALVGSGVLDEHSPVYRLTFPQPGRYVYVDLAQPALVGVIIVLAAE